LVAREKKGAVIESTEQAWLQMQEIMSTNKVKSIDGKKIDIKADTFCLHGDGKNAVELITYIRQCLSQ